MRSAPKNGPISDVNRLLDYYNRNVSFLITELKDQVIREQAEYLDEYRVEIMHLRGDKSNRQQQQPPKSPRKAAKDQSKEDESASDNALECSRALSEEEDTWSLPGIPKVDFRSKYKLK